MDKVLGAVAFLVLMIIIGPLCTIWSLNTLFPSLNIPVSFDTWVAVILLGGVFKTTVVKKD
jgi:hypothetical protein